MDHVHYADWGSLLIPEHIAHMTMHFLHNYGHHDDDGLIKANKYNEDVRLRRRQIYRLLIEKEFLGDRLSSKKNTASLVYKVGKHGLPNPKATTGQILLHSRYLANYLPRHIWNFFVGLVLNTLPFDMRTRHFVQRPNGNSENPPCRLLCGTGPDSLKHAFSECPVMLEVKDRLHLNAPRTAMEELQHSLLGFDSDRRKEATSLVIALWAIWCISRKGLFDTPEEATKLIMARIDNTTKEQEAVRDSKKAKAVEAAERRKQKARESFQYVERQLASLSPVDTIVFTDGSGKDGFAGAGATLCGPFNEGQPANPTRKRVDFHAPLGEGTNNLGELWAIGMALEYIIWLFANSTWIIGEIHIFSDSKYSTDALNGISTLKTNIALFHAVHEKQRVLEGMRIKVYFHWCKGHADIEFNEIADNLAGKANVISAAGGGLSYHNRNDLILNGKLLNHDYVDEPMAIDNG